MKWCVRWGLCEGEMLHLRKVAAGPGAGSSSTRAVPLGLPAPAAGVLCPPGPKTRCRGLLPGPRLLQGTAGPRSLRVTDT